MRQPTPSSRSRCGTRRCPLPPPAVRPSRPTATAHRPSTGPWNRSAPRTEDGPDGPARRRARNRAHLPPQCPPVSRSDDVRRESGVVPRDFSSLLALEPHGPDTFVGVSPPYSWGRIYGGQVIAQALWAAAATVPAARPVHSLHAYFILGGRLDEPVRYQA